MTVHHISDVSLAMLAKNSFLELRKIYFFFSNNGVMISFSFTILENNEASYENVKVLILTTSLLNLLIVFGGALQTTLQHHTSLNCFDNSVCKFFFSIFNLTRFFPSETFLGESWHPQSGFSHPQEQEECPECPEGADHVCWGRGQEFINRREGRGRKPL